MNYIVPVQIRQHLIPFFLKEFEGEQQTFLDKEVTAIKVSTTSSLGKLIRMFTIKAESPVETQVFQLYLSIEETPEGKVMEGTAYSFESGSKSLCRLPKDANKVINELMEDIFRISFIYFVDGYMKDDGSRLPDAIYKFIEIYDLLECGFDFEALRQLYYREKKKNCKLSRLQVRTSNRCYNS